MVLIGIDPLPYIYNVYKHMYMHMAYVYAYVCILDPSGHLSYPGAIRSKVPKTCDRRRTTHLKKMLLIGDHHPIPGVENNTWE
jgi:hypothetical protein